MAKVHQVLDVAKSFGMFHIRSRQDAMQSSLLNSEQKLSHGQLFSLNSVVDNRLVARLLTSSVEGGKKLTLLDSAPTTAGLSSGIIGISSIQLGGGGARFSLCVSYSNAKF